MNVVKNQLVTGAGEHHVLMWPSETEGYVDRKDGEKADFAITMGNYLPKDLSLANVNVQVGKGLRERDTGAGASVGIHTPFGDAMIDTQGAAYAQGSMGASGAALAALAAFPKELNHDHLEDMRFLADRAGIRANGQSTRNALAYDTTDGRGWDVYVWRTEAGSLGGADIRIALNRARTLADYAYTTSNGSAQLTFGKRGADKDQLLETIVRNASGTYNPQSRTNVDFSAGACVADAATLCIQQNRFEIKTAWRDFEGNTGVGYATKLGAGSGDFWFFDPSNNELIIKVLDGTPLSGSYWVFWKALSNVEFDLSVRDTLTNQLLTYHNPSGFVPGGHLDTDTIFRPDGAGAPSQHYDTQTDLPPNGTPTVHEGNDPSLIGPCVDDGDRAKCFGNRFLVSGTWEDFQGGSGDAHVIRKSDLSGYFWFFDQNNYEVLFKVLDGKPLTPNYWVFDAGLTNVASTFTVVDKTTGNWYSQTNPSGVSFATNLDVSTILEAAQGGQPLGEIEPFIDKITFEAVAPPDTTLEQALETVHDRLGVVTQPDGSLATVPSGIVAARPDFAGRVSGASVYGVRNQWGPNGFGSAGGGFLKYARDAVTGATLRLLPADAGVGYALALDNNVTTLDPSIAHEYVRATFDGKTVTNEPSGVRYVTGFTTDAALMDALKEIYVNGGVATPQQVQSLMLIPHTTRTMACADQFLSTDCEEYSGVTVSLQPGSTEDLQVAGRFKGNAYLDIHQDERITAGQLDKRTYNADGHFSLSTFAYVGTRPASDDYFQYSNVMPFFTLQVLGNPNGGSIVPETGINGEFYSNILSSAPADWSFPLLPFE